MCVSGEIAEGLGRGSGKLTSHPELLESLQRLIGAPGGLLSICLHLSYLHHYNDELVALHRLELIQCIHSFQLTGWDTHSHTHTHRTVSVFLFCPFTAASHWCLTMTFTFLKSWNRLNRSLFFSHMSHAQPSSISGGSYSYYCRQQELNTLIIRVQFNPSIHLHCAATHFRLTTGSDVCLSHQWHQLLGPALFY